MAIKPSGLRVPAVFCAGLLVCGLAVAQQVTISKDSKVHAEPSASAAVVGELKQGATAQVTGRKSGFVEVKSAGATGWIYSFNVREAGGGSATPVATPQRKGASTATIGIRGLEKEDLKNATFDGKQLDALDSFAK